MNQQVNLYLLEFRPRRDWINSLRLIQICTVALVGMVLLSVFDYWNRAQLNAEMERLQVILVTQTQQTAALERELTTRSGNENLTRELETREARLAQASELLAFLRTNNLGNFRGFSEYMKDLSRASFPGLWLTEFRLQNGGAHVYLAGVVEQSAMVPDFIGRLSGGNSSLRGKQFSRLLGNRQSLRETESRGGSVGEEYFDFVLETSR